MTAYPKEIVNIRTIIGISEQRLKPGLTHDQLSLGLENITKSGWVQIIRAFILCFLNREPGHDITLKSPS